MPALDMRTAASTSVSAEWPDAFEDPISMTLSKTNSLAWRYFAVKRRTPRLRSVAAASTFVLPFLTVSSLRSDNERVSRAKGEEIGSVPAEIRDGNVAYPAPAASTSYLGQTVFPVKSSVTMVLRVSSRCRLGHYAIGKSSTSRLRVSAYTYTSGSLNGLLSGTFVDDRFWPTG